MSVLDTIEALPASERLSYAIGCLRHLIDTPLVEGLQSTYSLTRRESQVLHLLMRRAPHPTSYEQLGHCFDNSTQQGVSVYIHKLRSKGLKIASVRGTGYMMETAERDRLMLDVGDVSVHPSPPSVIVRVTDRHLERWTEEEDRDMLRMHQRGDHLATIAREMSRTQRAVYCRLERLRSGKPISYTTYETIDAPIKAPPIRNETSALSAFVDNLKGKTLEELATARGLNRSEMMRVVLSVQERMDDLEFRDLALQIYPELAKINPELAMPD